MILDIKKTFILSLLLNILLPNSFAQENNSSETNKDIISAVYITGIGCPNCAATDHFLFNKFIKKYPNLIIVEYEIYRLRKDNIDIAKKYFKTYTPKGERPGIPFLIFNKNQHSSGKFQVKNSEKIIKTLKSNKFPLADGSSVDFKKLDITDLKGKIKIWTKNRILISGKKGNNNILKKILTEKDLSYALDGVKFEKTEPVTIQISKHKIKFDHAVKIGDWILQWKGKPVGKTEKKNILNENKSIVIKTKPKNENQKTINFKNDTVLKNVKEEKEEKQKLPVNISEKTNKTNKLINKNTGKIFIALALLGILFLVFYKIYPAKKIFFTLSYRQKNYIIVIISILFLTGFFILAKNFSPEFLTRIGGKLSLPVFTFVIALVDGFNPCNMFVLIFLLVLLISASDSRKRIYIVGYTFIFVVFVIYFTFMVAWLNIFKYIGFIAPLRITIAIIALAVGTINCKELLFFKKGVSLMIQDKHKGILYKKVNKMKGVIKTGSFWVLFSSSIMLASFSSLVELPCTAGFPIIYTGILSGKVLESSFIYYLYLFYYNLVYIIPLFVIITLFGWTFKAKQISERQVQTLKFIGGLIMILLGIILLVNPSMIGIAI
jgi:glutaredoxin